MSDLRVKRTNGSWLSLTGPIGPAGQNGQDGAQGPAGPDGPQGPQGPAGGTMTMADVVNTLYPVGAIYVSTSDTNPGTLFGVGTWAAFGAGRTLVGLDSGDPDFDTVEETGGAKTSSALVAHTHSITDPGHAHVLQRYPTTTGGSSGFTADTSMSGTPTDTTLSTKTATTGIAATDSAGSGASFSLMNPYVVVYLFKRTA